MSSKRWTADDLPDLSGRKVIVTGATSGIGRAAALALAGAGAHVVLAVRDVARGQAVADEAPGSTEVRSLDLTDLASVRSFAAGWDGDLDILINNAGVMAVPLSRTADGFELQIGTNHLGPFALTGLLFDRITDRVVTVASTAHRRGKISIDDLNWEQRDYERWGAYGQSKLANLQFTLELQPRLEEAGSSVRAFAVHPGWAATKLQGRTQNRLQHLAMAIGNRVLAQSEEHGAWPTLYAATQDLPGGSYVGPGGVGEIRGHPALVGRTSAAGDPETARQLWDLSERLTGVEFRVPAVA
ncbi:MAG: SDR family NAD(P)-dependent oxidoreductase [Solirubrobacterales bacterium]|nr:SDR family NAD(P)-dependent oxidoreductase [Solirubrobacterales bacterium]